MAQLTNSSTAKTSFYRVKIQTTVNELKRVLGEAQYKGSSPQDCVKYQWDCETDDEDVFTVYDWFEDDIEDDEIIEFHIGGRSEAICRKAKKELLTQLSK